MNAMASNTFSSDNDGGPMWGRFFDSIGHDEEGSVMSGSHRHGTDMQSYPSINELRSSHSELHPNDSASVVDANDDHASALSGLLRGHKGSGRHSAGAPVHVIDDGTYVFKFRTPSGRTHRFQARHDNIEHLREIVAGKLAIDPFFTEPSASSAVDAPIPDPEDFVLSYTDADGDTVLMTSDHDVADAVKIARGAGTDRVVLFLQGGKGWAEAGAGKSEAKAAEVSAAALKEEKEVEKAEAAAVAASGLSNSDPDPSSSFKPKSTAPPFQEDVFGIPKDLLLPASIGALALVIIGVFTISRLSSNNY